MINSYADNSFLLVLIYSPSTDIRAVRSERGRELESVGAWVERVKRGKDETFVRCVKLLCRILVGSKLLSEFLLLQITQTKTERKAGKDLKRATFAPELMTGEDMRLSAQGRQGTTSSSRLQQAFSRSSDLRPSGSLRRKAGKVSTCHSRPHAPPTRPSCSTHTFTADLLERSASAMATAWV